MDGIDHLVVNLKPLSVNKCWQGRRYKTRDYKQYEKDVMALLPRKIEGVDFSKRLSVELKFGFSNNSCDIDNPVKPILDILQKAYQFDDKQIIKMVLEKEHVRKGEEYFEFRVRNMNEHECFNGTVL